MKLLETQLPSLYSDAMLQKTWNVAPEYVENVYDILFTGSANLLSSIKSKDRAAALIINNVGGAFVAAAIVQFFEGEDDNPGNWSLAWTFEESDVPEDAIKVYLSDAQIHPYFASTAGSKYSIQFVDSSAVITTLTDAIVYLKKWLDENAKEGEETSIEADGIFEAKITPEYDDEIYIMKKNDKSGGGITSMIFKVEK